MQKAKIDAVGMTRDRLVVQLNKRGAVRDELWMRNVWKAFSHMVAVHHMEESINDIAAQMPEQLKRAA